MDPTVSNAASQENTCNTHPTVCLRGYLPPEDMDGRPMGKRATSQGNQLNKIYNEKTIFPLIKSKSLHVL